MQYLLIGPHEGKNAHYHGFVFRDGVCEVPDNEPEYIDAANRLLSRFYSAYPENLVIRWQSDGKLHLKTEVEPMPTPASSLAASGAGQDEDLDKDKGKKGRKDKE